MSPSVPCHQLSTHCRERARVAETWLRWALEPTQYNGDVGTTSTKSGVRHDDELEGVT
jgi:hypothetical protein